MHKCPKQEQRAWVPGDAIEIDCPGCGRTMEFFKDEQDRKCRKCGRKVANPKQQEG